MFLDFYVVVTALRNLGFKICGSYIQQVWPPLVYNVPSPTIIATWRRQLSQYERKNTPQTKGREKSLCMVGEVVRIRYRPVVLNLGGTPPKGASINFQAGASPYAVCNMKGLVNKFTNEHVYF